MYKILGYRIVSSANVFAAVILVGYLAVNTLLFIHVSDRLDKALRRVDKLEHYLVNTIAAQDIQEKQRTLHWLGGIKEGLDMAQTGEKDVLRRTRRAISNKDIVKNLLQRIKRLRRKNLKSKLKKIVAKERRATPTGDGGHKNVANNPVPEPPRALFTIWGGSECKKYSITVQTGQMVTADGSDYLCLPNNSTDKAFRPMSNRQGNTHKGVNIRGVTYGDIEDVMSSKIYPANDTASRNNKTVPCVVCIREKKSASVMLVAQIPDNLYTDYNMIREYGGVLMSSKQSNKFVCVSTGPTTYSNKAVDINNGLVDTVRLQPAELKCDSLYCDSSQIFSDKHRVSCVVGTI